MKDSVQLNGATSIHHLQCLDQCNNTIWSAASFVPAVNDETGLLESLLPTCPACGGLARPNILMFGDDGWASSRSEVQQAKLDYWLGKVERPVVLELGAGTYIPTARLFGENLDCPIIRINPSEPRVGEGRNVSLPVGALEGLNGIADALMRDGYFD